MTPLQRARAIRDRRAARHPSVPAGFTPIPGFEGKYAVSKNGQVYSHFFNKLLTLVPDNGYRIVSLGCGDRTSVHSIMAKTFLGDPPPGTEIDHKNRVRSDNRLANLRYIPHRHNQHNAAKHGRNGKMPKSRFKGVTLNRPDSGGWRAAIVTNGKWRRLGTFSTEENAARAYDREALKIYGRTATTNKSLGYFNVTA